MQSLSLHIPCPAGVLGTHFHIRAKSNGRFAFAKKLHDALNQTRAVTPRILNFRLVRFLSHDARQPGKAFAKIRPNRLQETNPKWTRNATALSRADFVPNLNTKGMP